MAERRHTNRNRLKIVLVGKATARAEEFFRRQIRVPSSFHPFPLNRESSRLIKHLADADVAVGSFFTEGMAHAAGKLKLLQAPNAGVDAFHLEGLPPTTSVANAYFHGPAVAEYVVMMVLALSRDLLKLDAQFRKGIWGGSWTQGEVPRSEVLGKSLGLIGYGHIGREVARRARAMGMPVSIISAHPPNRKPTGINFWKGPGALHQLLGRSDYVVLACPLNQATRGMIGPREFGKMKRSAFLINVARGPVIQEEALYQALKERRIAGAAIDVWYRYPKGKEPCQPSRFPFHRLSNIVMTPHVSGWMFGTRQKRLDLIAENIERLVAGRPLLNLVHGPRKHLPFKLK